MVFVAAASDKGVQGKEAAAEEESAHNEVADKNIGEFFDMFYCLFGVKKYIFFLFSFLCLI